MVVVERKDEVEVGVRREEARRVASQVSSIASEFPTLFPVHSE